MTLQFPREIGVPDALIINVSGGKDSQAMALTIEDMLPDGETWLVHADLGRMEWPQSKQMCISMAYRTPLVVLQHAKRDLLAEIWRKAEEKPGVVPFPDAKNRYCTAGWKRDVINKWIRNEFDEGLIVNAIGIRREESPRRAKAPEWYINEKASKHGRTVVNWHPILDWTLEDVWRRIGLTLPMLREYQAYYQDNKHRFESLDDAARMLKFPAHPAYLAGNERVSCALCVLASSNDLRIGAAHNPELYNKLVEIEEYSGSTFQHGRSLKDIGGDI